MLVVCIILLKAKLNNGNSLLKAKWQLWPGILLIFPFLKAFRLLRKAIEKILEIETFEAADKTLVRTWSKPITVNHLVVAEYTGSLTREGVQ